MAIEIVSFPINSMVIFHSYVKVYQRVTYGGVQKKIGDPQVTIGFTILKCSDNLADLDDDSGHHVMKPPCH